MSRSLFPFLTQRGGWLLIAAIFLTLAANLVQPSTAHAQHDSQNSDSSISPNLHVEEPSLPAQKERQRQTAIAGMVMLGLVIVVLLLFVLLAIWWAQRIRRLIDRPLPSNHPGDPLWYLRKGSTDDPRHDINSDSNSESPHG